MTDVVKILGTHPRILTLYIASDGERSMRYDGAKVKCADCDGWEEGTVCPRGCGVEIVSHQARSMAARRTLA